MKDFDHTFNEDVLYSFDNSVYFDIDLHQLFFPTILCFINRRFNYCLYNLFDSCYLFIIPGFTYLKFRSNIKLNLN